MNEKRILVLAGLIEDLPFAYDYQDGIEDMDAFNMAFNRFSCGTPACIAGWAVEMFGPGECKRADVLLGIDDERIWYPLFCPEEEGVAHVGYAPGEGPEFISPKRAAAQLRHLVKTGTVDWAATPLEEE